LLDIAVDQDIVKKSGAWYTYEGEQIGQGRENVKKFLIENPDLVMEIQDRVLREVGLLEGEEAADDGAEAEASGPTDPDDEPITLD
ncbi:MAG: DNA recombination/repair protein RecA, partial [Actinomycetota bacterium]